MLAQHMILLNVSSRTLICLSIYMRAQKDYVILQGQEMVIE